MKTISIISVLALSIVRLFGQGFVEKNVTVGDTSFGMPVPASYVAIEKDAEWAKAYLQAKEHVLTDERRNNTFILAMQTPERFAVSKKNGEITGGLDCWAVYPNFSAKSRMSLEQFATLNAQAESAFTKLDQTAKMSEFLGIKPSDFTDEQVRRQFATMTKPMIIGKSSRTLLTVAKDEVTYTVQAWVLVNGKFLFLYMNKSQDQLASGISEMHAWLKEIEDKTSATFDAKRKSAATGSPSDKARTFERLKALAEKGEPAAQYNLGLCYFRGEGVTKDMVESVKWYRKAADQGHADALNYLGLCYSQGYGVAKDEVEAVKWYRKAADQGHAIGQSNLGYCYSKGYGVAKDEIEAVKWWCKAADQGYASAQSTLGYYYSKNFNVPEDLIESVKWFRKAADQGDSDAMNRLGLCCILGIGVPKDEVEAIKWYRKSAEQGDADAQSNLGFCYFQGTGVARDEIEAYAYWNLAVMTDKYVRIQFNDTLAKLEKGMSPEARLRGQQRVKELQQEIEAKIAAKKAGK